MKKRRQINFDQMELALKFPSAEFHEDLTKNISRSNTTNNNAAPQVQLQLSQQESNVREIDTTTISDSK